MKEKVKRCQDPSCARTESEEHSFRCELCKAIRPFSPMDSRFWAKHPKIGLKLYEIRCVLHRLY